MNIVKDIVVPIVVVILSGTVAWYISQQTAKRTLEDRISEGRHVFQHIGFRYFHGLYNLYIEQPNGDRIISRNLNTQMKFQEILADIAEDIRWLRTNPKRFSTVSDTAELYPRIHRPRGLQ